MSFIQLANRFDRSRETKIYSYKLGFQDFNRYGRDLENCIIIASDDKVVEEFIEDCTRQFKGKWVWDKKHKAKYYELKGGHMRYYYEKYKSTQTNLVD